MEPTLAKYRSNNYSQSGEDGIIEELFDRIEVDGGWFCEFGAWDGKQYSNTYNLIDDNGDWKGVMIEANQERYKSLEDTAAQHPNKLYPINKVVKSSGENSLCNILSGTPIPDNFELLSIDVDGPDYFIWKELTEYSPKVVIIEYNPSLGPKIRHISEFTPDAWLKINQNMIESMDVFPSERQGERIRLMGSSFASMIELGKEKGYVPVSCTQNNIIFVRENLSDEVGISPEEYKNPTILYKDEYLPSEFYQDSVVENIWKIIHSIQNNGVLITLKLTAAKVKSGIRKLL